jgi:zinc protease
VKKIVFGELERVTNENLSDKEIQRVITARESSMVYRLESFNARANQLQSYNHYLGDPGKLTWDLDRFRKTTPDKIRAAAKKYIVPANVITIITNPGGAK